MLKDELVGTWKLVSMEYVQPDGRRNHPFGIHLLGCLMYDAHGNMSVQLMRGDRAFFESPDPLASKPQETKAAMDGAAFYFGTYSVDDEARVVSHAIEGSLFPNWLGVVQRRHVLIEGEKLSLRTEPMPFAGGSGVMVLTWRRLSGRAGAPGH
ncbi:lipocalin-like domain-containing protein [Myxococcus faecalis]|uniref:lipocalin-like domain-containing protein n=1 Tax=Myxococcus faecalis TaxID=3115646 RepID=UPI0038D1B6E5